MHAPTLVLPGKGLYVPNGHTCNAEGARRGYRHFHDDQIGQQVQVAGGRTMHAVAADALLYDPGGPVSTHVVEPTTSTTAMMQISQAERRATLRTKQRTLRARGHRRRGFHRRKLTHTTCQ